jgi:hypothetical protein
MSSRRVLSKLDKKEAPRRGTGVSNFTLTVRSFDGGVRKDSAIWRPTIVWYSTHCVDETFEKNARFQIRLTSTAEEDIDLSMLCSAPKTPFFAHPRLSILLVLIERRQLDS